MNGDAAKGMALQAGMKNERAMHARDKTTVMAFCSLLLAKVKGSSS